MPRLPNPILPGFHPDPSIVRVGDYYYIANSTFEWWPGVQIHRSRDLGTWELAGYALTRREQLDMRGNPDSGGVWAPGLSYADGQFWLVFSDVKALHGTSKDVRNYLVTATRAEGPWSDPIALNRSGFDPSLHHGKDGRKWLVNQLWKTSTGRDAFAGIVLQEYSPAERRLVGEPVNIFRGSPLGITEGPHLYPRDGYYYLLTAEGGTEWEHAVTMARSRALTGPYEIFPGNPMLTSRDNPENPLQKAGHGSMVQAPDGSWYLAHLCSRPAHGTRRCILGRETALQRVVWPPGEWPRLVSGGREPAADLELEGVEPTPYLSNFVDEFSSPRLDLNWNTLREPPDEGWLSLSARPGFLRLRGRHSLQSLFDQSLVGFRLLHHRCTMATRMEFEPRSFQQRAGLALYYNTSNYYHAYVTRAESGGRELGILACDNRRNREVLPERIELPPAGPLELKAILDGSRLQFAANCGAPGGEFPVGPVLDATILSDDYPGEGGLGNAFTGAFAALCAQDSGDQDVPADFDWFRYQSDPDDRLNGAS
jgi:xylan 1,4-beta-xylosidase